MNIRSLTRGDGVVIVAAVLLFVASFLSTWSCDGSACAGVELPMAWDNGALVMGVYLAGVIGAALIVVARMLPNPLKVAGIDLGQAGIVISVFAAWSALGAIFDPGGSLDTGSAGPDAGAGLILGLIAALILASAAVATPLVPALKGALIGAPKPQTPQPYGGQPQGGYGYPGAQQQPYGAQPGQPQSYGGQPGQPFDAQQAQAQQAPQPQAQQQAQQPQAPSQGGEFAPFWFAVPVARPLYGEDGAPTPIAELAPGNWYLAVEQRGAALIAQTQEGRRGVLQDTTGIQRG
ncbi:hypothetical protein [Streptomyces sp. N1]|uniref:hypothetical protein n=1 Tax=Streptomyces sp. N1 TaxID=576456 RepID=UPI0010139C0A|nr:hypothetical protein [Streptomyces sp. N1]